MTAGINRADAVVNEAARPEGRTVLRLGLSVLGAVFVVAAWLSQAHGYDLWAFWAVNPADPYATTADLSGQGVFRYAPPLALLFAPLGWLPIEAVMVLWMAAQLAALWYIAGRWALALVLFPPVWMDLVYGNVNVFLAAMIVAGFRYPGVWSFALLSKVTPGVGVLWFAVLREWRAFGWAVGVTLGFITVSLVIQGPDVWREWVAVLAASSSQPAPFDALPVPLWPRLVLAALLTAYAGLTDRRWLVPAAVTLAMPTLWVIAFAPLVGLRRDVVPEVDVGVRTRVLKRVRHGHVAR